MALWATGERTYSCNRLLKTAFRRGVACSTAVSTSLDLTRGQTGCLRFRGGPADKRDHLIAARRPVGRLAAEALQRRAFRIAMVDHGVSPGKRKVVLEKPVTVETPELIVVGTEFLAEEAAGPFKKAAGQLMALQFARGGAAPTRCDQNRLVTFSSQASARSFILKRDCWTKPGISLRIAVISRCPVCH